MNAEKEDTYKERLLVANRAQIKKQQTNPQSLEAISTQEPLTQTVLQGEAWTELAASVLNCLFTLFLPSEPVLIKEFLETNGTEACPI